MSGEVHKPTETEALAALRVRTPARLVVGRVGGSYLTQTQLELRADHAAAVDAVQTEMDLQRDFGDDLIRRTGLFEVASLARDKAEFLKCPELGRKLSDTARQAIRGACPAGADVQLVIGDGLSAAATAAQVPLILPLLEGGATARGWTFGQIFAVRHCRVGIFNDVGDVLAPRVVILLIGERPGLVTAESLSAYMAYRPAAGHTDAQRNLISNIHSRGVPPAVATDRILALVDQMLRLKTSGVAIKEELPDGLVGKQPPSLGATGVPPA